MDYNECLTKLFSSRSQKSKTALDHLERVLEKLGLPHRKIPAIHVAGTNGKGSVVTKIAAALTFEGYRVGLYTSPHITSFCERISINGELITDVAVVKFLERLFLFPSLTFFEYTTLLAFLYFAEQKVDVVVLETGLGGRLDATNVCDPCLTVITSISLDHTAILGNCLEDIAKEKAGIIKPHIPIVIGPRVPHEVVKKIADEKNAPLIQVEGVFENFELENQAIAEYALTALPDRFAVSAKNRSLGLLQVPACRFEEHSHKNAKSVIFDVAHNPDGIEKLFERVKAAYPNYPIVVVAGFSKDKDVDSALASIGMHAKSLFCVAADTERALPSSVLTKKAAKLTTVFACKDVASGLQKALEAGDSEKVVVVCGSFYIMDQAKSAFFRLPS